MLKRWLIYLASVLFGLALVGALLGAFVFALLYPTLPSLETLTDYQPKIPLRILSAEGELLGEFGEERRAIVKIQDVPQVMRQAILAAEDERFYQHGGVDYLSVARAAFANLTSGTQQGAGTITMQVARNFFLTRERTLTRKLREVLLAYKIEASLSKDEILELYVNQIFLGQRAYGFAAAAQIYYGKPLAQVDVAEAAMLAGLPKAPSAYNPVVNPKRARTRELYVLRRMHDLKFITDAQFKEAQDAPLVVRQTPARQHAPMPNSSPKWPARRSSRPMATRAIRAACASIRRYARPTRTPPMRQFAAACSTTTAGTDIAAPSHSLRLPDDPAELDAALDRAFQDLSDSDNLVAAIVLEASPAAIKAVRSDGDTVAISGDGLKFAARSLGDKAASGTRIRRGAVIQGQPATTRAPGRLRRCRRSSRPSSRSDPPTARSYSLVGGFDFDRNKFNHVTQALRQPGSASSRSSIRPHWKRASARQPWSTTHRCISRRRRPAATPGNPRTTTASSKGRCACAPRS